MSETKTTTNKEGTEFMPTTGSTENSLTYQTRFGEVALREDRLISFPKGLFGFDDCTVFGLSRMPNSSESPLLLLQCVNEPDLSFIVADPHALGLEIKEEDRATAFKETDMSKIDTQFLVILTMYDQGDSYYMTANMRAPILINSESRLGCQHILINKDYTTQHKL